MLAFGLAGYVQLRSNICVHNFSVTLSVDIVGNIGIATIAGVGGVTLIQASGIGYDCLVILCVDGEDTIFVFVSIVEAVNNKVGAGAFCGVLEGVEVLELTAGYHELSATAVLCVQQVGALSIMLLQQIEVTAFDVHAAAFCLNCGDVTYDGTCLNGQGAVIDNDTVAIVLLGENDAGLFCAGINNSQVAGCANSDQCKNLGICLCIPEIGSVVNLLAVQIQSYGVVNQQMSAQLYICQQLDGLAGLCSCNSLCQSCVVSIADGCHAVLQSGNGHGLTAQLYLTYSTVNNIVIRTCVVQSGIDIVFNDDLACGVTLCLDSNGLSFQHFLTSATVSNLVVRTVYCTSCFLVVFGSYSLGVSAGCRDYFGVGIVTVGAGDDLFTLGATGGSLGNRLFVVVACRLAFSYLTDGAGFGSGASCIDPIMALSVDIVVNIGVVTQGTCVGGVTLIHTGRIGGNANIVVLQSRDCFGVGVATDRTSVSGLAFNAASGCLSLFAGVLVACRLAFSYLTDRAGLGSGTSCISPIMAIVCTNGVATAVNAGAAYAGVVVIQLCGLDGVGFFTIVTFCRLCAVGGTCDIGVVGVFTKAVIFFFGLAVQFYDIAGQAFAFVCLNTVGYGAVFHNKRLADQICIVRIDFKTASGCRLRKIHILCCAEALNQDMIEFCAGGSLSADNGKVVNIQFAITNQRSIYICRSIVNCHVLNRQLAASITTKHVCTATAFARDGRILNRQACGGVICIQQSAFCAFANRYAHSIQNNGAIGSVSVNNRSSILRCVQNITVLNGNRHFHCLERTC